ncbi:hypothetical protein KAR91_65665 [Candidatus Pacearchaeota archaeon]|nr:hypothetical protein [Candidatus Pacearchaeota archaeon]
MNEFVLTKKEKDLLVRALDYFKKAEEREIRDLSLPSGNKEFIPACEDRLAIYESLIRKVQGLDD